MNVRFHPSHIIGQRMNSHKDIPQYYLFCLCIVIFLLSCVSHYFLMRTFQIKVNDSYIDPDMDITSHQPLFKFTEIALSFERKF